VDGEMTSRASAKVCMSTWLLDTNPFEAVIKNKGLEKITVNELVQEVIPRGRATVPESIKAELLQQIKTFLTSGAQSTNVKKDNFDASS
jgi:hypothetical protein